MLSVGCRQLDRCACELVPLSRCCSEFLFPRADRSKIKDPKPPEPLPTRSASGRYEFDWKMKTIGLFSILLSVATCHPDADFKPRKVLAVQQRSAEHHPYHVIPRGGAAGKALLEEKRTLEPGQYSIGKALEFHKAAWLPVSLAFNNYFNNFGHRACLMTALFGGYGINWVLKSHTFFDKNFYNDEMFIGPLLSVAVNMLLLSLFFFYPYLAAKNTDPISPFACMSSVLLFSLGTFLHYGADAQKHYTLKYKGPGLITDGFFSKLHSPSYVGENLIFASYTIVAGIKSKLVWIPVAYLLFGLLALGGKKSASLARYEGYEDWKKSTWF